MRATTTLNSRGSPFQSPWITLGLPGVITIALYAQLFPALVSEWTSFPSLSHGFAIPIIAAYLMWTGREHLRRPFEPSLWGLPILVLGLGGLVLGTQGQESFLARLSLPVTLLGLTLFLAGVQITRNVWLAIAYLLFMIPPPWVTLKTIMYRSRLLDATVSAHALDWLGVPVYRDGVLLHLPNITLEVADDCSSIPAIAALLALGVAYASLRPRRLPIRMVLVLITLPLAIASNMIRITSTAAAVYYIGPWTLSTVYHQFNGTVNFLLTFLLLLSVDAGLTRLVRGPKG
jgi:exosortase